MRWPRRRKYPASANTAIAHDSVCHRCLTCVTCYGGYRYRCGLLLCLHCDALVEARESMAMKVLLSQHPELAEMTALAAVIQGFYE